MCQLTISVYIYSVSFVIMWYCLWLTHIFHGLLAYLTEDYRSAWEKTVLAQLTSDLDTEETDIERGKSTARRQKSQFRLVDDVEPDNANGTLAASSSPPWLAQHTAPPSSTLCLPPPPPPASLTLKSVPSPASMTPKQQRTVSCSTPLTSYQIQDVTEHVPLQHGNICHFLYIKMSGESKHIQCVFRLHHLHTVQWSNILLQMSQIVWSVFWAHRWIVQKWFNWSRCRAVARRSQEPCIRWGSISPTGRGSFEGNGFCHQLNLWD